MSSPESPPQGQEGAVGAAGCPTCSRRRRRLRRAWLALGLLLVIAAGLLSRLHPFLAVTQRVPARVLVVEGWVPDYALEEAVAEYRRGGYNHVFTTGGPLTKGAALREFQTHAELAAVGLRRLGLSADEVTAVPSGVVHRNRTLGAAIALRDYCRGIGQPLGAFNLVTVGTHARRSRLCFRRAFGAGVAVGVVSIEDRDYDPSRWWAFSEGLKTTLGEPIGFLYACLAVDYGK